MDNYKGKKLMSRVVVTPSILKMLTLCRVPLKIKLVSILYLEMQKHFKMVHYK